MSFNLVIERLLISGLNATAPFEYDLSFNLVIERLLISGGDQNPSDGAQKCFHLVIERLFISGKQKRAHQTQQHKFQSRYRAASHFRRHDVCRLVRPPDVSISLSSGFSFQVMFMKSGISNAAIRFQSRSRAASHFRYRHDR